MSRPRIYLVRVPHADGRCLTWMHMCVRPSEALAWARRRWPDAGPISCESLRPRRALASLPRVRAAGACAEATVPFVGARRIKGGVPVFALPITPATL